MYRVVFYYHYFLSLCFIAYSRLFARFNCLQTREFFPIFRADVLKNVLIRWHHHHRKQHQHEHADRPANVFILLGSRRGRAFGVRRVSSPKTTKRKKRRNENEARFRVSSRARETRRLTTDAEAALYHARQERLRRVQREFSRVRWE